MQRILHVFGKMDRGGAETMIMNMYHNIDRSKIQFDFMVHSREKGDYDDEIREMGGKLFYISKFSFGTILKYGHSWKRFFKIHPEYKIIHGHIRSTASIYLPIADKHGLKTIVHSHSTSSGSSLCGIIKNLLQLPLRGNLADHYFACSKPAGQWLYGRNRLVKNNFHILKNAIETQKFIFNNQIRIKKREEMNIIQDNFVIGHVGRFHPSKNHDFILEIFSAIYSKHNQTRLIFIGTGDLEDAIKRKVRALGLSKVVKFLGARSDVPDLLQTLDIFLFPSLYEGLGMAAIEAQASGLPVIASDKVPSDVKITDLVDFVPLEKPASYWANKVLKYSGGYLRQNTYASIYKGGYDVKKNVQLLQAFYLKLES